MTAELRQQAISAAAHAACMYGRAQDVARYARHEFDMRYGRYWQCVALRRAAVDESATSLSVAHGLHVKLAVGEWVVVLWKSHDEKRQAGVDYGAGAKEAEAGGVRMDGGLWWTDSMWEAVQRAYCTPFPDYVGEGGAKGTGEEAEEEGDVGEGVGESERVGREQGGGV